MSAGARVLICEPGLRMRSSEKTTSSAVKVLAVVELDALAQIKAPLERVDDFPPLGQARNDLEILVALGQALHDVAHGAEREGLVQRVGVERVEIALEGIAEGLGGGRRGAESERKRADKRD